MACYTGGAENYEGEVYYGPNLRWSWVVHDSEGVEVARGFWYDTEEAAKWALWEHMAKLETSVGGGWAWLV